MALAPGHLGPGELALALAGTVLVVSAANALNMWWERDVDGLMARTKNRPLPAGRMSARAALIFGLLLGALAVPMLFAVNPLTGGLGLFALVCYVVAYTPMKRWSPLALQVGAVPGAIPPLLGWTSVTGRLDAGGLILFAILFLWQIPHFIAISIFRAEDYARAGLRVHAVAKGERSARATIGVYTAALVMITLLPVPFGLAGGKYLAAAAVLGGMFLTLAVHGAFTASILPWSRKVFGYSIVYLVVLLGAMLADRHPAHAALPAYGVVPDFTLTGADGKPFEAASLRGKVWIADFVFTSCKESCPVLTARMKNVGRAVPGAELVSFSVDPANDTPDVLAAYAARYGAEPGRWHFLTGPVDEIERVIGQGMKLALQRKEADILHANRFVLVDRTGKIRGYYDALAPDEMDALTRDARKTLAED